MWQMYGLGKINTGAVSNQEDSTQNKPAKYLNLTGHLNERKKLIHTKITIIRVRKKNFLGCE